MVVEMSGDVRRNVHVVVPPGSAVDWLGLGGVIATGKWVRRGRCGSDKTWLAHAKSRRPW